MLPYGQNYDRREKLPSQQFQVYPTDMNGNARLLQYEDYGIVPDIFLHANTSWIEQVTGLVKKKSN